VFTHALRLGMRWAAIATLVLWVAPSGVDATEITDRAERLFRQGRRALRQDRYAAAQSLFERSLGLHQNRNAYWNLAACHLSQGQRDLAVWSFERYMRLNPPYLESAEMQAAVGAIADSPASIEVGAQSGELAVLVNEASEAIEEGRSTPAAEDQRRFGADPPGAESQRLLQIADGFGRQLFGEGHRLIDEGWIEEALGYFERSLVYKPVRNALWNLAACHIGLGHRDFALIYIDGYLSHTPQARGNSQVQAVAGLIADEPPNMPNVDRRFELWGQFSTATNAALGSGPAQPRQEGS